MLSIILFCSILIYSEGSPVNDVPSQNPRIIGGSAIDIVQAPYQAQYEHIGIPVCGAAVISPVYALTAAHCTTRSLVSLVTIRVGSSARAHGGTAHDAVLIIRHERYTASPEIQYDIAIVRVAAVFMYDERVQPIPMAKATPRAGTRALVAGWGAAQEGGQPSTTLLGAAAEVWDRAACDAALAGRLGAASLCAGDGRELCPHDMGGPLVAGGLLVGVASWGAGCGEASSPGVYADVAELREWVRANSGI